MDRLLAEETDGLSRSRIKTLIETGNVSVNGEPVSDPNFRIKAASTIILTVPAPTPDHPMPQAIPLDVYYEDDHLIVVNKPAGLVVHPAAGNPDKTLVNALLSHCGETLMGIGGVKRPGIVHRLDKDTSGLLVAAKTDLAHANLTQQFSERTIQRKYAALVWGIPSPLSGTIVGSIGRSSTNRKKMAVVRRGGKEAVTHYRCQQTFGTLASLIQCQLETGRTHQIRVHMAHSGHGIIGDPVYGRGARRGTPKAIVDAVRAFGRQALHAGTLEFSHPETGKKMSFTAPLPDDFLKLQTDLEQAV